MKPEPACEPEPAACPHPPALVARYLVLTEEGVEAGAWCTLCGGSAEPAREKELDIA